MHHDHAAPRLEIAEIAPAFRKKSVADRFTRHARAATGVAGRIGRLEIGRRLGIAIVAGRTLAVAVFVRVGSGRGWSKREKRCGNSRRRGTTN